MRQQLDSFNDFIETTIQEIVMDSLPVELVSGNQHLTNEVEDTPTTRIKFGKVRRREEEEEKTPFGLLALPPAVASVVANMVQCMHRDCKRG